MKTETLAALRDARAAGTAAVRFVRLGDGAEALLVGDAVTSGTLALDATLRAAAASALRSDRGTVAETPAGQVFVEPFNPPLRLVVVGAVHITQGLAPMAQMAGYQVTVVDPRQAFASAERFPGVALSTDWPDDALEALAPDARTAVVTLTHDPKLDDPALDRALRSPAFYVAALGSRKTHAARLERLGALGHDAAALARIHGPAGLPLGAATPAEIAVSVLAEMTQVLRQPQRGGS
ncbi:MAG: XdhC family protein [Rhodospirillaceae bacterium]|nr:XdhC family protein [Rhodospirillaceae bacterium]